MAVGMSSGGLVYISYDRFPAPKGAATHIREFIKTLSGIFSSVDLVTVGSEICNVSEPSFGPAIGLADNVRHWELPAVGPSLIERVLCFRNQLRGWLKHRRPDVIHFRSIYEGYPLAKHKHRYCDKLVFEVNGLPSIELKYHYPKVADDRELLRKLALQEQACLDAADLVITVSDVNADHLRSRGVSNQRLRVIPNGVDPHLFPFRPPVAKDHREIGLLYAGTLSSWQGVDVVIESLALVRKEIPANLTIVGTGRTDQLRRLTECAIRFDVVDHVRVIGSVDQRELARLHNEADVIVVPLTANDRNLIQGCCPLKLLEAMSSGTPVVASNLPVVSALARDQVEALLVRPGSAKAIKDAVVKLMTEPELAATLLRNARQRIEDAFTWSHAAAKLTAAYRRLQPQIDPRLELS